jgi:hypothetical protein
MPEQTVNHPFDPDCPYCKTEEERAAKADRDRYNAAAREARENRKTQAPKRQYDRTRPELPAWAVSKVTDPRWQKKQRR